MSQKTLKFVNSLRVTHAIPGRVKFELDVEQHHTNRLKILHGGTIASMVTYLNSGGTEGNTIRAEVVCDKFGKTLAYTNIKFFNDKNEIVARGSHTKYVTLAWKDPQNIVEEIKAEEAALKDSAGETK
ncbi:putative thioesterase family [Neofusicoccum parvum]|uniref:Putative_thioesterase family protein n=3 Tax=Neofusicoccum TaxID=407951 RepID=R1EZ78_BOTPV|nr:putative _thioesterase family protein [Neofusicoccum parvum UCRNP2]GME28262.1 putative thioesterase family [Neofusicoccum parvum]GME63908.1 putative thioesterase family [Neofusicoccum parvum]